jgi:hypothetical protein
MALVTDAPRTGMHVHAPCAARHTTTRYTRQEINLRGAREEREMQIDGTCHCGLISFIAEIDPRGVTICHCADCQVMSGGPFRTVVEVSIGQFKLTGEPRRYTMVQHGNRWVQAFCPVCGTPLFAAAAEIPSSVVVRLGCVTQRAQLRPFAQIWQNVAVPWLSELPLIPGSSEQQGVAPPRSGGRGDA